MSQRGETGFVAMRVGRLGDPREVEGLADDLKVRPVEALAYVLLWEEFILQVGDALTGRVKGYRAKDIARKLTHTGPVEKLIRAMETAGILKRQRSTFFHPYWQETITGHYALQRAQRRETDREKKRRQREQARLEAEADARGETFVPDVSPGTAGGHPGDSPHGPEGSLETKEESKKGTAGSGRPPSPPRDAGGVGFARWKRVRDLHPRPMNPTTCILLLEAMTDEDWALCLWVLENRDRERLASISRKKRAFALDSCEFLRKQAFLQFRHEYTRKLAAPKETDPTTAAAELEQQREDGRRRAIRDVLEDPDCPEPEKERKRAIYLRAHPGDAAWIASIASPSPSPATNGVSN